MLYCFLKYLRECQFFKEIVIFQKSDPFFVLFQTAITLLILTLHWKAMLFWKCLYPYFNFKWLFHVTTEVKISLWHTFLKSVSSVSLQHVGPSNRVPVSLSGKEFLEPISPKYFGSRGYVTKDLYVLNKIYFVKHFSSWDIYIYILETSLNL